MKMMSKADAKTLEMLTSGLVNPSEEGASSRRFKADGFMDLVVERIGEKMFSLAHYYMKDGDPMRDPEMTFYRAADGYWMACSFRMDGFPGIDRESVFFADGKPTSFRARAQREDGNFAAQWLRNLRAQHDFSGRKAA